MTQEVEVQNYSLLTVDIPILEYQDTILPLLKYMEPASELNVFTMAKSFLHSKISFDG